jgi:hypothetical protein
MLESVMGLSLTLVRYRQVKVEKRINLDLNALSNCLSSLRKHTLSEISIVLKRHEHAKKDSA